VVVEWAELAAASLVPVVTAGAGALELTAMVDLAAQARMVVGVVELRVPD
jgi:hypothetical protein